MKKLLNKIYKHFYIRKIMRKKIIKKYHDSNIDSTALLNELTILEGNNIIYAGVNINGSELGFGTYVCAKSLLPNCLIGRFCSIASNVRSQAWTHPTSFVSSYPGFFKTINNIPFGKGTALFEEHLTVDGKHEVRIGNDVWIGENVTIKGGVTIADGAIIGMGAVVTKNVPPYAVVAGVPAKIIRYRFDSKTIDLLLKIKWWNWPIELIKERRDEFTDVKLFVEKYSKDKGCIK